MALQEYDLIPNGMRIYLRNNGRHFSKRLCDMAVSQMRKRGKNGNTERLTPMSKEELDTLLAKYGIKIERNRGYDYVYVANMCKADFLGSSVPDDMHLALYVRDVIDDVDATEGQVFNRWLADCDSQGLPIDWEDVL